MDLSPEYAPLAKLYLEITREFVGLYLSEKYFGMYAPELIVITGILIGQTENRPMSVTKLAEYVGIPRPTVYRKLRQLELRGIVTVEGDGHLATVRYDIIKSPERLKALFKMNKLVHDATIKLSKLDGLVTRDKKMSDTFDPPQT